MSRKYDEEYEDTNKHMEVYSDIDEFSDIEDEQNIEDNNYEYFDYISDKAEVLRDYACVQGLPLCEYINANLLVEFLENNY